MMNPAPSKYSIYIRNLFKNYEKNNGNIKGLTKIK